ncbi:hypothetical protein GCM10027423_34930 [Spirosoma arcticum]
MGGGDTPQVPADALLVGLVGVSSAPGNNDVIRQADTRLNGVVATMILNPAYWQLQPALVTANHRRRRSIADGRCFQ